MLHNKLGMIYNKIMLVTTLVLLTGCDGIEGTGAQNRSSSSPATKSLFLRGTAAQGAPIKNTVVTVKDSAGTKVTGTTDDNGQFVIEIVNLKAPYLLSVKRKNNSVLYGLTSDSGTVNIHPFTDLTIRNWFAVQGFSVDSVFNDTMPLNPFPTSDTIRLIEISIRNILGYSEMSITKSDSAVNSSLNLKPYNFPFFADGTGFDHYLDFSNVVIKNNKINVTIINPNDLIESLLISNVNLDTDFTLPDLLAPSKPTNFRATATANAGSSDITLSWAASVDNRGIKLYRVYRNGQFLIDTPFRNYIDVSLTMGNIYCYSVKALDGNENESLATQDSCISASVSNDVIPP